MYVCIMEDIILHILRDIPFDPYIFLYTYNTSVIIKMYHKCIILKYVENYSLRCCFNFVSISSLISIWI